MVLRKEKKKPTQNHGIAVAQFCKIFKQTVYKGEACLYLRAHMVKISKT